MFLFQVVEKQPEKVVKAISFAQKNEPLTDRDKGQKPSEAQQPRKDTVEIAKIKTKAIKAVKRINTIPTEAKQAIIKDIKSAETPQALQNVLENVKNKYNIKDKAFDDLIEQLKQLKSTQSQSSSDGVQNTTTDNMKFSSTQQTTADATRDAKETVDKMDPRKEEGGFWKAV